MVYNNKNFLDPRGTIMPTEGNKETAQEIIKKVDEVTGLPLGEVIDIFKQKGEVVSQETHEFEHQVKKEVDESEILAEREKVEGEREEVLAALDKENRRLKMTDEELTNPSETVANNQPESNKMKEYKEKYQNISLHGSSVAEERFKKYLGVNSENGEKVDTQLTDEQKVESEKTYESAVQGQMNKEELEKKVKEGQLTPTQGRLFEWVNEMSTQLSGVVDSGKVKDLFGSKVFEYLRTRVDYNPFQVDEAANLQDLLTRFDGMYKNDKGEYIGSYSQDSMNQNMSKALEKLGVVVGKDMPAKVSEELVKLYREGKLADLSKMEKLPDELNQYMNNLPELVTEAGEDLSYAAEVLPKLTDGDMTVFDKLRAYKLWKKEEKWLERTQEGMKSWYEKAGGQSIPLVGEGLGKILASDKPKEYVKDLEKKGLETINKFGLQGVADVMGILKNNGVEQSKIIEFFNNDQYRYLLDSVTAVPMNQDDIYNLGGMVENWQGLLADKGLSEEMLKENSEALMFLTGVLHNTPDVLERFPQEYFTGENSAANAAAYEKWIMGKKDELAI
ncbi:MAG: hypothetical protein WC570_05060 [Patescibacteria group bacterium]